MKGLSADLQKFADNNNGGDDMFTDALEAFGNEQEALNSTRDHFLEAIETVIFEEGITTAADAKKQAEFLAKAAEVLAAFEKFVK